MSDAKPGAMVDRRRCVCSPTGFLTVSWANDYYPPECPMDWHLAYFMNDFRVLYLSAADWYESDALWPLISEEIEDWFELVLEWPLLAHARELQRVLEKLDPLKQHIACVVIDTDMVSVLPLEVICREVSQHYAVSLGSKKSDSSVLQTLSTRLQTDRVWFPQHSGQPGSAFRYQVVRTPCLGLREMAQVLNQLRPGIEQGVRTGLFLESSAYSAKRALEVRTLIELMGLD